MLSREIPAACRGEIAYKHPSSRFISGSHTLRGHASGFAYGVLKQVQHDDMCFNLLYFHEFFM